MNEQIRLFPPENFDEDEEAMEISAKAGKREKGEVQQVYPLKSNKEIKKEKKKTEKIIESVKKKIEELKTEKP